MEGRSWATEEYVACITRAVLDAYAQYIVTSSHFSEGVLAGSAGCAEVEGMPRSVEEALAPLEILYGKTALSAIGIALHGAEPIIRYVERAEVNASGDDESDTLDDEDVTTNQETQCAGSSGGGAVSVTRCSRAALQEDDQGSVCAVSPKFREQRGRCIYHVGEHTLFSPYYCPCSAYVYQSIQRQEVWCCKHLLALQLALRIEGTGMPQDNLLVRVVDPAEYEQLLLHAL
ncbi:hypothetical protein CUR178_00601 [Leishmania enriettii]|uniref:SWIM-type domain-containing protein n=1 Tax=Leishmania enriettii TaxID=5663 RepID=A0A836G175_LEIEN|nr:hypothetical protein CUR178_00601 [Leishmania enriettii]